MRDRTGCHPWVNKYWGMNMCIWEKYLCREGKRRGLSREVGWEVGWRETSKQQDAILDKSRIIFR